MRCTGTSGLSGQVFIRTPAGNRLASTAEVHTHPGRLVHAQLLLALPSKAHHVDYRQALTWNPSQLLLHRTQGMQNGTERPQRQSNTSENEGQPHNCGTDLFKATQPASGNCHARNTNFVSSRRLDTLTHGVASLTSTLKTTHPR